jgi:hypothetical protein
LSIVDGQFAIADLRLPIADFQLRFTMAKFPDYNSTIAVQLAIGNRAIGNRKSLHS